MQRKFERRRAVQDFGQVLQNRRHVGLVILRDDALHLLPDEVDGQEVQYRLGLFGTERERQFIPIGTISQRDAFRQIPHQPFEHREKRRDVGAGRLSRSDNLRHVELQIHAAVHHVIHREVERRRLPLRRATLQVGNGDIPILAEGERLHHARQHRRKYRPNQSGSRTSRDFHAANVDSRVRFPHHADTVCLREVPRASKLVLRHHDIQGERHAFGRDLAAVSQRAAILRVRPRERISRAILAQRKRHVRNRRNYLPRDGARSQAGNLWNLLGRKQETEIQCTRQHERRRLAIGRIELNLLTQHLATAIGKRQIVITKRRVRLFTQAR